MSLILYYVKRVGRQGETRHGRPDAFGARMERRRYVHGEVHSLRHPVDVEGQILRKILPLHRPVVIDVVEVEGQELRQVGLLRTLRIRDVDVVPPVSESLVQIPLDAVLARIVAKCEKHLRTAGEESPVDGLDGCGECLAKPVHQTPPEHRRKQEEIEFVEVDLKNAHR